MPSAAASQQPSTCELWHALVTQAPEMGYHRLSQKWRIPTIGRDSPKEKA